MSHLEDLTSEARRLRAEHPRAGYLTLWELLFARFPTADSQLIGVALMCAAEQEPDALPRPGRRMGPLMRWERRLLNQKASFLAVGGLLAMALLLWVTKP